MSSIVKYACEELGGAEIECIVVDGEPWFKFLPVAKVLGFDTKDARSKALSRHIHDDDKKTFEALVSDGRVAKNGNPTVSVSGLNFVNESGLYTLIFGSSKAEAKVFKRWVTSEALPDIGASSTDFCDFRASPSPGDRHHPRQVIGITRAR